MGIEDHHFYKTWIGRKDEFPIYKVTRKEIVGESCHSFIPTTIH